MTRVKFPSPSKLHSARRVTQRALFRDARSSAVARAARRAMRAAPRATPTALERRAAPRESRRARRRARAAFTTSDGVELEVARASPTTTAPTPTSRRAPLVFVHGSYHAAWCYEEHFAGYFNARGRETTSVSLRGHGASGTTPGAATAGTLASHARDVGEVVRSARGDEDEGPAPVVFGHSFGGLVAQKMVADGDVEVSGLGLLASVPPSGNGEMVKRFLKRDLWTSLKITYAFITKAFGTNPRLCRECFFSPSLSDEDVARFAAKINASSELRMLDLKALKEELPVQKPAAGSRNADVPVLVLGGALDFVVDREGLEETASWFAPRAELVVEPSLAHDVMLDADWEIAAARIERWLVDNGL